MHMHVCAYPVSCIPFSCCVSESDMTQNLICHTHPDMQCLQLCSAYTTTVSMCIMTSVAKYTYVQASIPQYEPRFSRGLQESWLQPPGTEGCFCNCLVQPDMHCY